MGQMQQDATLDEPNVLEPAEERPKPISTFGSFTATLSDGMVLALSNYGNKGTPFGAGNKNTCVFKILCLCCRFVKSAK